MLVKIYRYVSYNRKDKVWKKWRKMKLPRWAKNVQVKWDITDIIDSFCVRGLCIASSSMDVKIGGTKLYFLVSNNGVSCGFHFEFGSKNLFNIWHWHGRSHSNRFLPKWNSHQKTKISESLYQLQTGWLVGLSFIMHPIYYGDRLLSSSSATQ